MIQKSVENQSCSYRECPIMGRPFIGDSDYRTNSVHVESVVIISYFSEVVARPLLQNMGTNTGYFGLNLMLLFVINY